MPKKNGHSEHSSILANSKGNNYVAFNSSVAYNNAQNYGGRDALFTGEQGVGLAHENIPPYLSVAFIVKF